MCTKLLAVFLMLHILSQHQTAALSQSGDLISMGSHSNPPPYP